MTGLVRGAALTLLALAGALLLACASGEGEPELDATAPPAATGAVLTGDAGLDSGYPRYVDEATGLSIILGTPDLGVGRERVAFVLSDSEGLVRLPVASIASRFADDALDAEPHESTTARFYAFPEDTRGLYVTALDFDRAGEWVLEVSYPDPEGGATSTSFAFEVTERAHSIAVGDPAPASANRTLRDVPDVHELSTGASPDPVLYEQTIAEALEGARPLVVVFASPGFCTNALCGPQAEVLSDLAARYGDRASFVHVDLYENPTEIRTGGLEIAIETPLLEEWGLETDEWTFVIDADGVVAARFEAFAPESEVEQALLAVLEGA